MNESSKNEDQNNNNENNEEEYYEDCLKCNAVKCFKLDEYDNEYPEIGRELYFGELLFKKIHYEKNDELADIICKNNSVFQGVCFFVNTISEIVESEILRDSLFQSARDLKVTIFLAMTGNYRNAMQVLRCSYETLLFCLYYMLDLVEAKDEREINKIKRAYKRWISGGSRLRIDVYLEIFRRLGFISREEASNWNSLYSNLSKYIHTPRSTWGRKIKEEDLELDLSCIANNIFDSEDFKLWSENYRKVLYILIKIGLNFVPLTKIKKIDSGKLAINIIKGEIDTYFERHEEERNEENFLVKLQNLLE